MLGRSLWQPIFKQANSEHGQWVSVQVQRTAGTSLPSPAPPSAAEWPPAPLPALTVRFPYVPSLRPVAAQSRAASPGPAAPHPGRHPGQDVTRAESPPGGGGTGCQPPPRPPPPHRGPRHPQPRPAPGPLPAPGAATAPSTPTTGAARVPRRTLPPARPRVATVSRQAPAARHWPPHPKWRRLLPAAAAASHIGQAGGTASGKARPSLPPSLRPPAPPSLSPSRRRRQ